MVWAAGRGGGMDVETREHIFEPFFTTKERGKGTGLGLATIYGIVRQAGGQSGLSAAPGRGSTSKLSFPAGDEEPPTLDPPGPRPPVSATKGSVLLVED